MTENTFNHICLTGTIAVSGLSRIILTFLFTIYK